MKFASMKRPKLGRNGGAAVKAKVVHEVASVCVWCGAVESYRTERTVKKDGRIIRYSVCTACGRHVTRVVTVPKSG